MRQSHLSALPKWAAFNLHFYDVSTCSQEVWSCSWHKSTDGGLNESATCPSTCLLLTKLMWHNLKAWLGVQSEQGRHSTKHESSFNGHFPSHVHHMIHVNMSCDQDKPPTTLMWDQAENDPEKTFRFLTTRDLHLIRRDFSSSDCNAMSLVRHVRVSWLSYNRRFLVAIFLSSRGQYKGEFKI